jgi:hypothetical protein
LRGQRLGFFAMVCQDGLPNVSPKGVGAIVVIEVCEARPLVSPAYDDGITTEADVISTHRAPPWRWLIVARGTGATRPRSWP